VVGAAARGAAVALLATASLLVYLGAATFILRRARARRGERVAEVGGIARWGPAFAWVPYAILAFEIGPRILVPDTVAWIGAALVVGGVLFALWALAVIGRHFDLELEAHADHEVVRGGPYRAMRHPIYSGLIVHTVGAFIASGNLLFGAGSLCGTVPLLVARARIEEELLRRQLGTAYDAYARDVGMLIPFLGRARSIRQ
jgi:protein-S-isoprenylcysteine O-methyltransferase Ste14